MKSSLYFNRELSWIEFNSRVLGEARNEKVPLLDRLFFLTVTASNLDEFFMVRIGGLKLMIEGNINTVDPSGMTPHEQLKQCLERLRGMVKEQYLCLNRELLPAAARHGIRLRPARELSPAQQAFVSRYFDETVASTHTPVAVAVDNPPAIVNRALYMAFQLKKPDMPDAVHAIVRLGQDRLVFLPGDEAVEALLLEEAVALHAGRFFSGYAIEASACFRVNRNADIPVREEYAEDLASAMEATLRERRSSGCVRLEMSAGTPSPLREAIIQMAQADRDITFDIPGPIDLTGLAPLCRREELSHLRYPSWPPQLCHELDPNKNIFEEIAERDILLSLPFERFDPVTRLVQEAAGDPNVLAIKIILYRTAAKSAIAAALIAAAEAGKSVTAIVEIKARFDEAANMANARKMEMAGVQVIHGIKGLKTHAKACLIVRREEGHIVRYVHLGTGNYNETTAKFYTDVGLLSSNPALGSDVASFFNAITGYSLPQDYLKIAQSPLAIRDRLLALIDTETQRAATGQPARIMAKMNSLADPKLIAALYAASKAGVAIELNIRGICTLRPGVKGMSETIRVVSIVDRLLEHSRIFRFHHGGDDLVFISSADWMPRNLDRRIELMTPVDDPACKKKLIALLETCLKDTAKGRLLLPDGTYAPPAPGKKSLRAQEHLYKRACDAAKLREKRRTTTFVPHRPKKNGTIK